VGDEDPLRGFFFGSKDDAANEGVLDGKAGKNTPRDFEW